MILSRCEIYWKGGDQYGRAHNRDAHEADRHGGVRRRFYGGPAGDGEEVKA